MPRLLILALGASLLPDSDVVIGLLIGDLLGVHNTVMSSLLVGVPVSLMVAGGALLIQRSGFVTLFGITLLSYELHLIMDFFSAGRGIMLFWPFSAERYLAPVSLFYGLHWSQGWTSIHHLWTLLSELFFVGLLMLALSQLPAPTHRSPLPDDRHAD